MGGAPGRIRSYRNEAEAGLISDGCADLKRLSIARRLVLGAASEACLSALPTSDKGKYVVPGSGVMLGAETARWRSDRTMPVGLEVL
jgi:hypothetical protein